MNNADLIMKLSLLRDYCSTTDFAVIKAEDVQKAIDIIRAYGAITELAVWASKDSYNKIWRPDDQKSPFDGI